MAGYCRNRKPAEKRIGNKTTSEELNENDGVMKHGVTGMEHGKMLASSICASA